MRNFNILMVLTVLLFVSGCVKPVQDNQTVYPNTAAQPVYPSTTTTATTQPIVFEEAQPLIYEASGNTISNGTMITGTEIAQPTTYPDNTYSTGVATTTAYPDPYANDTAMTTTSYPNPYESGGSNTIISDYPASTPTATVGQGGGIHLQIAALKDYYTAEDYKNRLSLEPGLSAYVKRGTMNKVIVSGIPSVAEANRLKETRFPGAFIVQGGTSTGYTPPVQPNYGATNTSSYTVDTPYGNSASTGSSSFGVQIGAFGSQGKAQAVANNQSGQYPAVVRKIGQYYKVILTGFSNRSAAKAHATRVGGFVVSSY